MTARAGCLPGVFDQRSTAQGSTPSDRPLVFDQRPAGWPPAPAAPFRRRPPAPSPLRLQVGGGGRTGRALRGAGPGLRGAGRGAGPARRELPAEGSRRRRGAGGRGPRRRVPPRRPRCGGSRRPSAAARLAPPGSRAPGRALRARPPSDRRPNRLATAPGRPNGGPPQPPLWPPPPILCVTVTVDPSHG